VLRLDGQCDFGVTPGLQTIHKTAFLSSFSLLVPGWTDTEIVVDFGTGSRIV